MMPNSDSVPIVYSVIEEALTSQQDQKTSLETKASALTAFAGGMFALMMAARASLVLLSALSRSLILLSISLFVASVVLANIVTWIRRYRFDPNPVTFAEQYLSSNAQAIQLQLISNMISSWKANLVIIERNANFLRATFISQLLAFLLLGLALFVSILGM